MECTLRNTIQVINKDGSQQTIFRCANRSCPAFTKDVTQVDCTECPFRAAPITEVASEVVAPKATPERRGLGDWVEKMLNRVGVTEDRYKTAKAFLLMKKKEEVSCRCPLRKRWLNKVEKDLRRFLRSA